MFIRFGFLNETVAPPKANYFNFGATETSK